jgi:hypothetical protein
LLSIKNLPYVKFQTEIGMEQLKAQLELESSRSYAPLSLFGKNKNDIDNNYLVPQTNEALEQSLQGLGSGSIIARYNSYMCDVKVIKKDLSEAFSDYKRKREAEETAERQKVDYWRMRKRREEGLTLTAAEADLVNNATVEGMNAYVNEQKSHREKAQQRKTTLTDQLENLETKASNLRNKHGASVIMQDEYGRNVRKFTSATVGIQQPNKRDQKEVALALIKRFTTPESLLKLDFDKGLLLVKEYRDSFEPTHDMNYLYSLIANNMENSKFIIDRIGFSKMLYEGLNKERQNDFNRAISNLSSNKENLAEMRLPALKERRDKLLAEKLKKSTPKSAEKAKTGKFNKPRGGQRNRGRGRGRGRSRGRGRGGYGGSHKNYYDSYQQQPRWFQEPSSQPAQASQSQEKPTGDNNPAGSFRGRGRGGFRGGRGGRY